MPRIWLSLGSNVDRRENLRHSVQNLSTALGPLVLSRVYESDAVGFEGDRFYNMVVGVETDLDIPDLMALLRGMEAAQGRVRGGGKFAPRTLDIDLLTYGDRVVKDTGVELPRDEIVKYAFVLRPLAEVAGEEVHPVMSNSYRQLWEAFDASGQPLWPVDLAF
jgi:2-amino-4-hydroxy-6-hydroxymethyldihydropteridine diphosphokinase